MCADSSPHPHPFFVVWEWHLQKFQAWLYFFLIFFFFKLTASLSTKYCDLSEVSRVYCALIVICGYLITMKRVWLFHFLSRMALCWEQTHELLRTLLWRTRTVPKSTTLPQTSSEYGGGGGHTIYDIIQLYCLYVEKFAFWLVIYIKTSGGGGSGKFYLSTDLLRNIWLD